VLRSALVSQPADQLFFDSIREDAVANYSLRRAAMANSQENFSYAFLKAVEGLFWKESRDLTMANTV